MAKGSALKEPAAGQRGNDPNRAGLMSREEGEQPERRIQPVKPKERPDSPQTALKPAKECKAADLYAWLLETGMVKAQLTGAMAWMSSRKEATGEDLFRYLEDAFYSDDRRIQEATVRRTGKHLWGDEWDLKTAVAANPIEEIAGLRKAVAEKETVIAGNNSELASCKMQLKHLMDRCTDQQREINALKAGRRPEELAAIGVDLPKNVTLDPAYPG